MGRKERKAGESFAGRVGRILGDFQSNPSGIEKKYGSRIYERFGVNPFDQKKGDPPININTAL